jgi:hypothetical protein
MIFEPGGFFMFLVVMEAIRAGFAWVVEVVTGGAGGAGDKVI